MPASTGTASEQTIFMFFFTRDPPSPSANIGWVPSVPESTIATENPAPSSLSRAPSPSTSTAPSWTGTARVATWEVSEKASCSSSAQSTRVTPAVLPSFVIWAGVPTATAMPIRSRPVSGSSPAERAADSAAVMLPPAWTMTRTGVVALTSARCWRRDGIRVVDAVLGDSESRLAWAGAAARRATRATAAATGRAGRRMGSRFDRDREGAVDRITTRRGRGYLSGGSNVTVTCSKPLCR